MVYCPSPEMVSPFTQLAILTLCSSSTKGQTGVKLADYILILMNGLFKDSFLSYSAWPQERGREKKERVREKKREREREDRERGWTRGEQQGELLSEAHI